MIELQRLTTEYVECEDRIRIAGEVENAPAQVLWLTRRLLERLLPHLTLWLEKQQGNLPHADLLLGFAQQSAQANLAAQPPVQAAADSQAWLVQAVDIGTDAEQMQLTFKNPQGQRAQLRFSALALRQWLGILHQAYAMARWPLDVWPQWMIEASARAPEPAQVWH